MEYVFKSEVQGVRLRLPPSNCELFVWNSEFRILRARTRPFLAQSASRREHMHTSRNSSQVQVANANPNAEHLDKKRPRTTAKSKEQRAPWLTFLRTLLHRSIDYLFLVPLITISTHLHLPAPLARLLRMH